MMAGKIIERQIKVVCEQSIAKNMKKTDEGIPWRNWKIRIFGVTEMGEEYQLKFVDYVEYIMHPSFTNPKRIQRKPPFTLSEKGWGEFDLKIVLHFPDEIADPQPIDFDLNFKQEKYEVAHVLSFEDPSPEFAQILSLSDNGSKPSPLSASTSSTKKRRNSTSKAGVVTGARRSSLSEGKKSKKPVSAYGSAQVSGGANASGSQSPTTPSLSDVSMSPDMEMGGMKGVPKGINMDILAEKLRNLEGEDLWELQRIVNANKTDEMYINEDESESELVMDLYTLGESLLRKLWEFTMSAQHKRHRDA